MQVNMVQVLHGTYLRTAIQFGYELFLLRFSVQINMAQCLHETNYHG